MKKILFIQSKFDFNQFLDKEIFPDTNNVEFSGINYLNKPVEFFSKYNQIYNCDYSDIHAAAITNKAKRAGVETFLLMDGIYDWANSYLNPKWANNKFHFDISIYKLVYCVDNHTSSYFRLTGIKSKLYKLDQFNKEFDTKLFSKYLEFLFLSFKKYF